MLCKSCNQSIPDDAIQCPVCGSSIQECVVSDSNNDTQNNIKNNSVEQESEIKTYLFPSILVTMLCCNFLGVIAIYHAGKVSTLLALQRYEEARIESFSAKKWVTITFVLGITLDLLAIVLFICSAICIFLKTTGTIQ